MGTGIGHLDYAHDRIPRFASVRTVDGATHLQICVTVGKPLKRAAPWALLGFFVAGIGLVVVTFLLVRAPAPWRWLPMIGGAVWLLAALGAFLLFGLSMAAPRIRGEAVVDSE